MENKQIDPSTVLIDKLLRDVSDLRSENRNLTMRTNELLILFESLLTYMTKKGILDMKDFESTVNQITDDVMVDDDIAQSFDMDMSKSKTIDVKPSNPLNRTPMFKPTIGEA